ncbi:Uncharacterised protein [Mycobacterium tuberculosis]|nr:Uncharacterised protein [Mycobacterium tuberculosis]
MCHRYSAITLALPTASTRCKRRARINRLSAGASAIASPACAQPNANAAAVGGVVLSTVCPGTPIMLTG